MDRTRVRAWRRSWCGASGLWRSIRPPSAVAGGGRRGPRSTGSARRRGRRSSIRAVPRARSSAGAGRPRPTCGDARARRPHRGPGARVRPRPQVPSSSRRPARGTRRQGRRRRRSPARRPRTRGRRAGPARRGTSARHRRTPRAASGSGSTARPRCDTVPTVELLLIRQARALRVEGVDGPADPGLSELGRRQAEAMATCLLPDGLDPVYTSPLPRAVETAEPLGEALALTPTPEAALAEYDAEAPAYIPIEELRAAGDPRWMEVPDDIAGFQGRVVVGIDRLVAAHRSPRVAPACR